MSVCPKSSRPWVRTLLHSVFDQADPESVAAQYDRRLDTLAQKLPKIADYLDTPRGPAGIHRLPQTNLAPNLVEQPHRYLESIG
jgi:hypothetical protein